MKTKIDKHKRIHSALRKIGLALCSSNNTITTDDPDTKVNEKSWKIDHSKEISDLEYIEKVLIDAGIYHECKCCNVKSGS